MIVLLSIILALCVCILALQCWIACTNWLLLSSIKVLTKTSKFQSERLDIHAHCIQKLSDDKTVETSSQDIKATAVIVTESCEIPSQIQAAIQGNLKVSQRKSGTIAQADSISAT